MADEIIVMYAGKIVERGVAEEIYYRSQHPYTQGLLKSIPRVDADAKTSTLFSIPGLPPDPSRLPVGCAFAPRCTFVKDSCQQDKPIPVRKLSTSHAAACHLEIAQ